jgi:hypothetical protein
VEMFEPNKSNRTEYDQEPREDTLWDG